MELRQLRHLRLLETASAQHTGAHAQGETVCTGQAQQGEILPPAQRTLHALELVDTRPMVSCEAQLWQTWSLKEGDAEKSVEKMLSRVVLRCRAGQLDSLGG
eukprot:1147992-Pelagomonas_calceolata.AAC.10